VIASSLTACLDGIQARSVDVEADIAAGLPSFSIVGLTDKAVQEARERVRSAMRNSGFGFPARLLSRPPTNWRCNGRWHGMCRANFLG